MQLSTQPTLLIRICNPNVNENGDLKSPCQKRSGFQIPTSRSQRRKPRLPKVNVASAN